MTINETGKTEEVLNAQAVALWAFSAFGDLILSTRNLFENTKNRGVTKKTAMVKVPLPFNALSCDINDMRKKIVKYACLILWLCENYIILK
jgi:hypothetical protein